MRGVKGHAEIGALPAGASASWKWRPRLAGEPTSRSMSISAHYGACRRRRQRRGRRHDRRALIPLLKPGDILAHPFTRHPGGFVNREGQVHRVIHAALERGLKVDVGHGSHFSYRLARKALDAGVIPHTLGADMHGYNTEVPPPPGTPREHADDENHPFKGQARFCLTQAMSSMMALGLPLETVVPMVTSNPAAMLGLADRIGALKVGFDADVTVLHDERGRFLLRDNEDTKVVAEQLLRPAFCLARAAASTPIRRSCRRLKRRQPCRRRARASSRLGLARPDPAQRGLRQQCGGRGQRSAGSSPQRGLGQVSPGPPPGQPRHPLCAGDRLGFDLYPASEAEAPCLVFIHGGYWQRNSRELFATFAEGVAEAGWSVAMPGYTLAPQARLTTIVEEIGAALDWLADHGPAHGIGGPVVLSGWSAGAQLAALHLGHRLVAAASPFPASTISGPCATPRSTMR